jgi:hypothetical protein
MLVCTLALIAAALLSASLAYASVSDTPRNAATVPPQGSRPAPSGQVPAMERKPERIKAHVRYFV